MEGKKILKVERQHKYREVLMIFVLSFLLTGTLLAYHEPTTVATASSTNQITQSSVPLPPVVTQTVRVAIYLETNTTNPSYAAHGGMSSNTTGVQRVLQAAGCQVTNLTRADISQHKLITASYDVFIMVDNVPRENITNLVKEFWLGGGGVLSLDSAISYVCYAGMIPPESNGSEGYNVYWKYLNIYSQVNVTARHPVTEAFGIKTKITTSSVNYATFKWAALQGTRVAGDLVKLGTELNLPNNASIVALDPKLKGGRVVQLPCTGNPITSNMTKLIVDAVSWLCPHPKAHIVYDKSHGNPENVDSWDGPGGAAYSSWRDALVNRSYTFDKLYPLASGNLTASRLAPYDILIEATPLVNFTSAEVSTVTNWINGGGSLLAIGEYPRFFSTIDKRINYLLSNANLWINVTIPVTSSNSYSTKVEHPTLEGCSSINIYGGAYVNYTSPAYKIWGDASNTTVAGQSLGSGRIILIGDTNWADNLYLSQGSNYQYAINVVNWLTAAKADVLLYVETSYGQPSGFKDPNWNVYRGPAASALNDLGIQFYLTSSYSSGTAGSYFNLSLTTKPWTLVIVDNVYFGNVANYMPRVLNYMKAGGHLILSSWNYHVPQMASLNRYLGFSNTNSLYNTLPCIYLWNSAHDIFTMPNHYGANNISNNLVRNPWIFGDNVTTFSNATAVAGLGRTANTSNATIILSASGRAITNTIALTYYANDTDDSTYPDSFEIWENEIAYMLRPQCSLTPSVVSNVYQGTVLNVQVSVSSFGLRAAMQGQVTLNVPAGLGTLLSPAAQSFTTPLNPGSSSTLSWQVNVTGTGSSTLGFSASYRGYKGTSYGASSTAGTLALASPTPLSFAQYGFSIESNATNFDVAASTTPQPGAAAPAGGQEPFVYLNMTGTIPPGYSVAYVKLYFSRAVVQQLGLNETALSLSRWNASASQWQAISTAVQILNSTHGVMTAYINHFSYFAVFAAPALGGAGIGMETLLVIAAAAIVVVVVVAFVVVRKRKR